jgi:hypothetical protein
MNPDTFFFVELTVDNEAYVYGPYLDLESATLILVDLMPSIANIKAKNKSYSYECKISEKVMDSKDEWKDISTHIVQNRCFRKKRG